MRRFFLLILLTVALALPVLPAARAEEPVKYLVLLRGANLRGGPGKQYPVVGGFPAGARISYIGTVTGQAIAPDNADRKSVV